MGTALSNSNAPKLKLMSVKKQMNPRPFENAESIFMSKEWETLKLKA